MTSPVPAATERGDDDPASPITLSVAPAAAAAVVGSAASAGWGRGASCFSLVGGSADTTATDSVSVVNSLGTAFAASDTGGGGAGGSKAASTLVLV
jgi:hypothetical protein